MTSATNTLHPHHEKLIDAEGRWQYANALAQQTSPYLLQHAHNPVDWDAWDEAAFEKARREDKPIFLSVGYSTCYWCHVMERQVFEDPQIAQTLNHTCVSIKVDREERPDVDELYMTAVQMMTGHGGWPASLFLTPPGANGADDPGLKPFWAGTYLPPEPMHGMPGFPQLIENLGEAWQSRRQEVLDQAEKVADAMRGHLGGEYAPAALSVEAVQRTANEMLHHYDAESGGFGSAPKFPQPTTLLFLFAVYDNNHLASIREALDHTLRAMARGGMYDQVGGGFHRYSTDAKWLVPHFEKMLYDNGQLLEAYAAAYQRIDDSSTRRVYERVMAETAEYVMREMVDATGAFYSAQDAEVAGREGGNYLWTPEQVREAIDDAALAEIAVSMYGLDRGTNFRDPHDPDATPMNVLHLPESLQSFAEHTGRSIEDVETARTRINQQLLAARDQRPQPRTDDKVLVSWNGLMIAGLARVGSVLDRPRYIEAAGAAVKAIEHHLWRSDDTLLRTMREQTAALDGQLEDYALLTHGLIELHRATGEAHYLDLAQRAARRAIEQFESEQGGYYDTPPGRADLLIRLRTAIDGSVPSGNSQMAHNLIDLYQLTGNSDYLDRAERDLRAFAEPLAQQGRAMTHMVHAGLRALEMAPDRFTAQARSRRSEHEATASDPASLVQIEMKSTTIDLSEDAAETSLHIKPMEGYHINAHDPGDPTLTPTTVQMEGSDALRLHVDYPAGNRHEYAFADGAIYVYDEEMVIPLRFRKIAPLKPDEQPAVVVRYQPCSDHACHHPQTRRFVLRVTDAERGR